MALAHRSLHLEKGDSQFQTGCGESTVWGKDLARGGADSEKGGAVKGTTIILAIILVLLVERGAVWAQDPGYVLSIPDGSGLAGQIVHVPTLLDNQHGRNISSWYLGVCQEGDAAELEGISPGAATLSINHGAGPDFSSVEELSRGWTAIVIVNFMSQSSLPPADAHELHVGYYRGHHEGSITLSYCSPTRLYDFQGVGIDPLTEGGSVQVAMGTQTLFVRGDVDGNGLFNGLVDAIFLLNFLFTPGSPAPPCLASADVDGELGFDGLVEALYILNYQFLPGSPPIAAPFAPDCDVDPLTTTNLGCNLLNPLCS